MVSNEGDWIQVSYRTGIVSDSPGPISTPGLLDPTDLAIRLYRQLASATRAALAAIDTPIAPPPDARALEVKQVLTRLVGDQFEGNESTGEHIKFSMLHVASDDALSLNFTFEAVRTTATLPDGVVSPDDKTFVGFRRAGDWQLILTALPVGGNLPTAQSVAEMLDELIAPFVERASLSELVSEHLPASFTPIFGGTTPDSYVVAIDPATGTGLRISVTPAVDHRTLRADRPSTSSIPEGTILNDTSETFQLLTNADDLITMMVSAGVSDPSIGAPDWARALAVSIAGGLTDDMRAAITAPVPARAIDTKDLRRRLATVLATATGEPEDIVGSQGAVYGHITAGLGSAPWPTSTRSSGKVAVKRFIFEALLTDVQLPDGVVTPDGRTFVGFRSAGGWQLVLRAMGVDNPAPSPESVNAMMDQIAPLFTEWSQSAAANSAKVVPPGSFPYVVQAGDTLTKIWKSFDISEQDFFAANPGMTVDSPIYPGDIVYIGGPA